MDRRVLVTGGAGYVGCRLVPELLREGYKVRVLDSMIYGSEGLSVLRDEVALGNLDIIQGDIRDKDALKKSLESIDSVVHLASISNDPSSDLNPELTRQVNFFGHDLLVRAAKESGVNRFIFASSSSVYGIKNEDSVNEDLSLEPLTLYSKSKVHGERTLLEENSPDFATTSLRPATVCGYSPRQRLDVVVNIFTYSAFRKGVITVNGGDQKRPNIHISDMVNAYLSLLKEDRGKISGKTYNFGGENHTLMQLAQIVQRNMTSRRDTSIEVKPYTTDSRSYAISSKKINDELGIAAVRSIDDAVKELEEMLTTAVIPDPESDNCRNVRKIRELGAENLLFPGI